METATRSTPGAELGAIPADVSRRNRLHPPRGLLGKSLIAAKDWFEERIARASIHGDPPVYDPALFPWTAQLERNWRLMRREVEALLPERDRIPSFHEISDKVETITRDADWKTFFLIGFGVRSELGARLCPESMRLVESIPGVQTAFFSILSPGKHIPPHRGPYCGFLRYHLGLIVPEPREACRIRIGREIHHWEEGKSLVFDDTYNHEVWNDTGGIRVILFVDFLRPLRPPYDRINRAVLALADRTRVVREARRNQRRFEERMAARLERRGGPGRGVTRARPASSRARPSDGGR